MYAIGLKINIRHLEGATIWHAERLHVEPFNEVLGDYRILQLSMWEIRLIVSLMRT